jgi:sensor histidine kinase regulating citrate/malate metabolism
MRIDITDDGENKRYIDMDLTATDSLFMCRMKNAVGIMPQIENGLFKTIKTNKAHHGVGMQSMRQTCEELGGGLAFEYDEKEFRLWINLPTDRLIEKKSVDSV